MSRKRLFVLTSVCLLLFVGYTMIQRPEESVSENQVEAKAKKIEQDKKDHAKEPEKQIEKQENKTVNNSSIREEIIHKPSNEPTPHSMPENKPIVHKHNWTAKSIHHEEKGHIEKYEIQPAWDEKEVAARDICNQCGADITDNVVEHGKNHALAGENGGHHTEWRETGNIIHHEAVFEEEWVVDQKAWDETYYICSECGKRK